jgi:acetyltransferase-like isoleucine patch superfamily enzyme
MNIGSNVAIGPGVKIFTHDTAFHQISEGAVPIKFGYVTIGDNSWIGANSVVANCIIGKHCIIAPNTLVNRNVPDYSLVMGVPGEVVKSTQRLIERTQVKTDPVD